MKKKLTVAITALFLGAGLGLAAAIVLPSSGNAQKAATDERGQTEMKIIVNSLQDSLAGVLNNELQSAERQKHYINITKNIPRLLLLEESTLLSDADLETALPSLQAQTKAAKTEGGAIKVRIVRWDCFLKGSCGTLQRYWVYVQWWDGGSPKAQVLSRRGESTPVDFLVLPVDGKPTLLLAEYSKVYSPYPHVLATWRLTDSEWAKAPMFGPNVAADEKWDLRISGNDVILESRPPKPLKVTPNAQGDGFIFFVTEDKSEAIELRVKEGLVVWEH